MTVGQTALPLLVHVIRPWIAGLRGSKQSLTRSAYLELEKPSEREPVRHYANVDSTLYGAILNRCVDAERLCMDQMMALDAGGGLGLEGLNSLAMPRRGDPRLGAYVSADVCTVDQPPLSPLSAGMKAP